MQATTTTKPDDVKVSEAERKGDGAVITLEGASYAALMEPGCAALAVERARDLGVASPAVAKQGAITPVRDPEAPHKRTEAWTREITLQPSRD